MPNSCKHDEGFNFVYNGPYGYIAVWQCSKCSFYLNFDPLKYPDGVAFLKEGEKPRYTLPKLSTGGKY